MWVSSGVALSLALIHLPETCWSAQLRIVQRGPLHLSCILFLCSSHIFVSEAILVSQVPNTVFSSQQACWARLGSPSVLQSENTVGSKPWAVRGHTSFISCLSRLLPFFPGDWCHVFCLLLILFEVSKKIKSPVFHPFQNCKLLWAFHFKW
jgi:hypothetical protein